MDEGKRGTKRRRKCVKVSASSDSTAQDREWNRNRFPSDVLIQIFKRTPKRAWMTIFCTCKEWCDVADVVLLERNYTVPSGMEILRLYATSWSHLLELHDKEKVSSLSLHDKEKISSLSLLNHICQHCRRDVVERLSPEKNEMLLSAAVHTNPSEFERLCSPSNYWVWQSLLGAGKNFGAEMFKIVEKQVSRFSSTPSIGSTLSAYFYKTILFPIVCPLGITANHFDEGQTYSLASALRDSILSGDKYKDTMFVMSMMTIVLSRITLCRYPEKPKETKRNEDVVKWVVDWIEKRLSVVTWTDNDQVLSLCQTMFRLSREMRRARVSPLALVPSRNARLSRNRASMIGVLIMEAFVCSFPTAEYQRHPDWYPLVAAIIRASVNKSHTSRNFVLPSTFAGVSISPRFGVILDDCVREKFSPVELPPSPIANLRRRVRSADQEGEEVSELDGYDVSY